MVRVFEQGLKKGYKDFALIGTEVGAYGKDLGTDLVALLKELINKKGEYKVKLRNVQPRYLIEMLPELRKIFQTGKISFLSCALESGNNRILRLMNRGYKIEDFKAAIRTLNKEFPDKFFRNEIFRIEKGAKSWIDCALKYPEWNRNWKKLGQSIGTPF